MYDTLSLWLEKDREQTAHSLKHLESVRGFVSERGELTESGNVGSMKVSIKERGVFVSGSLSKFAFGNNLERLTRQRTQQALEELSDKLALPLTQARVYRFDVGSNFILKHPPSEYLSQLDTKPYCKRSEYADLSTLNFSTDKYLCGLYDKVREMKRRRVAVPEIFENRHVLRYEVQFKRRLGEQFGVKDLAASRLFEELFYIKVLQQWKEHYFSIKRRARLCVSDAIELHSTKDLQAYLCALALQDSEREAAIIERLESHREAGKVNERTFYRLKASLRSYRSNKSLTQPNERLEELDRHVKREVQYYR